jgi:hypothetical protein
MLLSLIPAAYRNIRPERPKMPDFSVDWLGLRRIDRHSSPGKVHFNTPTHCLSGITKLKAVRNSIRRFADTLSNADFSGNIDKAPRHISKSWPKADLQCWAVSILAHHSVNRASVSFDGSYIGGDAWAKAGIRPYRASINCRNCRLDSFRLC